MAATEERHAVEIVGEALRAHSELHERVEERVARHKELIRSTHKTHKTRKSARTRQRIMDTATQLIVERGNTAFRMSDVSRRCGMSKGALYYYFSDKNDLVNEIFSASVDELVAGVDAVVEDSPTPEEALLGICNEFEKRVGEGSPLPMAIVRELVQSREGTVATEEMRITHIVDVLARLLEQAKEDGSVRADIDTHLAATAVCGAFTFGALSATAGNEVTTEFAEGVLDVVIRGVGTALP